MRYFWFTFPPEIIRKKKKDNLLEKAVPLHSLKSLDGRKNLRTRKILVKVFIEISTDLL